MYLCLESKWLISFWLIVLSNIGLYNTGQCSKSLFLFILRGRKMVEENMNDKRWQHSERSHQENKIVINTTQVEIVIKIIHTDIHIMTKEWVHDTKDNLTLNTKILSGVYMQEHDIYYNKEISYLNMYFPWRYIIQLTAPMFCLVL